MDQLDPAAIERLMWLSERHPGLKDTIGLLCALTRFDIIDQWKRSATSGDREAAWSKYWLVDQVEEQLLGILERAKREQRTADESSSERTGT